MKMLHTNTTKHIDGMIELTILVYGKVDREYTFLLNSQFDVDKFIAFYRRGAFGRAINHLKKVAIKESKR